MQTYPNCRSSADDILISVIIPVYNVAQFLPQCINSLLAQTHPNMEIILVDDGSTDSSGLICDDYATQHDHIQVIHQKNAGQAAARNAGLSVMRGEYIGFVDSDDLVAPEMFRELLNAALSQNAQIAACGRSIIDEQGSVLEVSHTLDQPTDYSSVQAIEEVLNYGKLDVAVWDKLYRRELFDGIFFPAVETNEDAAVIFPLLCRTSRVIHIGKTMYYYRTRSVSVTKCSYHPRKAVMMDHADTTEALLLDQYPQLRKACRRYRAYSACNLLCNMLKDPASRKRYPDDYRRFIRDLRTNILYLLNNPNVDRNWKLRGILVSLGLYESLYQLLKR